MMGHRHIEPVLLGPGAVEVIGWGESDDLGFVFDHEFQQVWCPIAGPSAVCIVRELVACLRHDGDWLEAVKVDRDELARACGLDCGDNGARHSRFAKAVNRAIAYDLIRADATTLAVRITFPALTLRQRSKLTATAQAVHERLWLAQHAAAVS